MMSYFSFIQQASIEKCHSAALAWIFSGSNTHFSDDTKTKILSSWSNTPVTGKLKKLIVEYKNIDILLEFEDVVIAIENKIKISEHDNQLAKYTETLAGDYPDHKVIKLFLSLAGEDPTEPDWIKLEYDSVLASLKSFPVSSEIIQDYAENLECLVSAKNEFLNDHIKFPNVFTDGNKPKLQKLLEISNLPNLPATAKYISFNGLETILQKAFFHRLIAMHDFKCKKIVISETRGNGLIDFRGLEGIAPLGIEGGNFIEFGIQIQGNTIKAQFMDSLESNENRRPKSPATKDILDNNIPNIYEGLQSSNKAWRMNRPKKSDSAYYSFSRRIDFSNGKSEFYECSAEECLKTFVKHFNDCAEILKHTHEALASKLE